MNLHEDTFLRSEVLPTDREAVLSIVRSTGFFTSKEEDIAVELVDGHLTQGEASGYLFFFFPGAVTSLPSAYACYGPDDHQSGLFHLYWIAVSAGQRFAGLGTLLLGRVERAVTEAQGRRVRIETSSQAKYAPTRKFYEARGYRHMLTVRDQYAPGDDCLIYEKDLIPSS